MMNAEMESTVKEKMEHHHEEEHRFRSQNESKSSFPEDEAHVDSAPSIQHSESLNVQEPCRTCEQESELSHADAELGEKECPCLLSPLSKSTPLAFDVNVTEIPEDMKVVPHEDSKAPADDMKDVFPVCVQLPTSRLHKSPNNMHERTKRHRKISQCSSSTSRSVVNLKSPVEDLCASVLLACLFCRVCDCALALADSCQFCIASLCSSFCCCEPSCLSCLEDVLLVCSGCSCHECVEACGSSWGAENALNCSLCDICLQTGECLELSMELSQLLFH